MTYIKNKTPLDPKLIDDAISEVNELAEREGVRIAIIGGLAMQAYGSDRFTFDVDFIADSLISSLTGTDLSFGGVRSQLSNGIVVDVIVREDAQAPLYEAALSSTVGGENGSIVAPEFIAAMKFWAGRPKDDLDLEFLIASGQLDLDALRKILRNYMGAYAVTDFDRVLEEVAWKIARSKK